MANRVGFNFRQTLGYVTDGAGDTFVSNSEIYSATPGYGWNASPSGSRNRSTANGPRLAGIVYTGGNQNFRYDLPNGPGLYRIKAGFFDPGGSANPTDWDFRDGVTKFAEVRGIVSDGGAGVDGKDATGTNLSYADWNSLDGGNALDRTFVASYFTLLCADLGGNNVVAHLSFEPLTPLNTVTYSGVNMLVGIG